MAKLTEEQEQKLSELESSIRSKLQTGGRFAIAADLVAVKKILIPPDAKSKYEKKVWGDWITKNQFNGLPRSTAFKLIAAYEEATKRYHPEFLKAFAESGLSLEVSSNKAKPLGKYTANADAHADAIAPNADLTAEKAADIMLSVATIEKPKKEKKPYLVQKIELAESTIDKLASIIKRENNMTGEEEPSDYLFQQELTAFVNHLLFSANFPEKECDFAPVEMVEMTAAPSASSEGEEEEEAEPTAEAPSVPSEIPGPLIEAAKAEPVNEALTRAEEEVATAQHIAAAKSAKREKKLVADQRKTTNLAGKKYDAG